MERVDESKLIRVNPPKLPFSRTRRELVISLSHPKITPKISSSSSLFPGSLWSTFFFL